MANETETPSPFIQLEYCSLDRAARLLSCEVEDIFHWAEVGAITIYAQFCDSARSEGEEFLVGQVYLHECAYDILVTPEYEGYELPYGEKELYVKKVRVNPLGAINMDPRYLSTDHRWFKFGAEMYLSHPDEGLLDRTVRLSGFWAVDRLSIPPVQNITSINNEVRWSLNAAYVGDELTESQSAIELHDVEIDDIYSRLRVMREDLLKIQSELISNEFVADIFHTHHSAESPLPVTKTNTDMDPIVRQERVTTKQCSFIVDLLRSHGLTDTDFKGSIGELRLKIASKIPATSDPDVDDKTLSDWLKKAGVR